MLCAVRVLCLCLFSPRETRPSKKQNLEKETYKRKQENKYKQPKTGRRENEPEKRTIWEKISNFKKKKKKKRKEIKTVWVDTWKNTREKEQGGKRTTATMTHIQREAG